MTTPTERRNRKRGIALTLGLHALVVAGFIYPWLVSERATPKPYETVVAFDFTASVSAANSPKRERTKSIHSATEREAAPERPVPPALPTKPAPPILSAPSPLPPVPNLPEPVTPAPEPEPSLEPELVPEPVVVEAPNPAPPASTTGASGDSHVGADADGSPELGDDSAVADAGAGRSSIGSALEGDGVLARAVVFRPRLDEVVLRNGSVVLNLCINPGGNVIGVKYNEDRSTITDMAVVRAAIAKAQQYRFASDRSAPARECGTLSIHIKGL